MSSIVIALPQIEDAKKIRAVLERHGFIVASVCTTASNALSSASELGSGVLICSHRLPDMNYLDLSECMPREFEMLHQHHFGIGYIILFLPGPCLRFLFLFSSSPLLLRQDHIYRIDKITRLNRHLYRQNRCRHLTDYPRRCKQQHFKFSRHGPGRNRIIYPMPK